MTDKPQKSPFDPGQFMENYWKMFDPKKQAELFDPKKLMASMKSYAPGDVDLNEVFSQNQRNFEGVMQANQAAAETYRGMLEKQMEILNRVTQEAQELASSDGTQPSDAASNYSKAYSRAFEIGLSMMKDMAEEVQKANEVVYGKYQERLNEAVEDLKSK